MSETTTNHDTIKRWAEARNARPAKVRDTAGRHGAGIIRIDFPGYTGEESLEEISWSEWFDTFEQQQLALIYEDDDSSEHSNFNKLVRRH